MSDLLLMQLPQQESELLHTILGRSERLGVKWKFFFLFAAAAAAEVTSMETGNFLILNNRDEQFLLP